MIRITRGLAACSPTLVDEVGETPSCAGLTTLADRPWADDDGPGKAITPRHLAKLLDGFTIKARQIRQGPVTRKGYVRSDFTMPSAAIGHPKHRNTVSVASLSEARREPRRAQDQSDKDVLRARDVSHVSDVSDELDGDKCSRCRGVGEPRPLDGLV